MRPGGVYLVRQAGASGKPQLAIAERFAGACTSGNPRGGQLVRDARRIATLATPNVARVREVTPRGEDLVVFSDFVDGERLSELWNPEKLPLEIALRILLDALTGLGALHNLRDGNQQPMKLAHGEVSPATLAVGIDGVARLLHAVARRAPDVVPDEGSLGYLAPEVATGEPYDARADVFGAGVLLWEALSGRRLFPERDPVANARRVRSGSLPRATVPAKSPWASGLVDVAARALSPVPDDRWGTAALMAAELRKASGLKLAPVSTAAAFAKGAFGDRVKKRHEALEGGGATVTSPKPPPLRSTSVDPAPAFPPPVTVADASPPAPPAEMVVVAPGLRAPVAEIVELGSDILMEAPISSIPPAPAEGTAPSSAVGGFLLDPFAVRASIEPRPAPPIIAQPVVAIGAPPPPPPTLTVEDEAPPSVTGSPHFAAAIDLAPPALPPPIEAHFEIPEPMRTSPSLKRQAEEAVREVRTARRRKALVLGSVGAVGLLVFVLAAVRVAGRGGDTTADSTKPTTTTPATPSPAVPAATAATAAQAQPTVAAASPPPPPSPAANTPTPATTAQPPPKVVPPNPTAAPSPTFAAAPRATQSPAPRATSAPKPAVAATQRATTPKPRPKPTFDPNSL
ncbi:MAG TPA: hypothetical protein VIF09_05000 [Polyangiaceae bacterium]|jgi:serine/threonine-protein kinase